MGRSILKVGFHSDWATTWAVPLAALMVAQGCEGDSLDFPPPIPPAVTTEITQDDFAGAEACEECHEVEYEAWQASTHGLAGGGPSTDTVIAPFDGTPIRFKDAVVTPSINASGEYIFTVERAGREPLVFRVDGVVGGGHMFGGGTQGFVSRFPDGTVRFLPFDFGRSDAVWFCNTGEIAGWWVAGSRPTGRRLDQGWIPISEDLELAACGDWPPQRILGTNARFANCQQCHGSQITVRYDAVSRRYETDIKSLTINCESCHGPAKRHVELADAERLDETTDLGVRALELLDEDASLEVCFRCHAVKRTIAPGYLPGDPLEEHYSLLLPLIGGNPFRGDGRVRTFAYQQNHRSSSCYLDGTITCADCHNPHSLDYWDIYRRPMEGRFADEQCLDCHASKADDITGHTGHEVESEGSRCVACHMPYLQHPRVGDRLRFARSDHTISIPRPVFDTELGIVDACTGCHQDSTVAQLQQITDEWYGELKPHKAIVADLIQIQSGNPPAAVDRLLDPEAAHPMAQVAAIDQVVQWFFRPNMQQLAPEVVSALLQLTQNDDLDVRSLALAAVHLAWGDDREIRTFLVDVLRGLGDRDAAVRKRWVFALRYYGDTYLQQGDAQNAITTYRKALEVLPGDPQVLVDLATVYASSRDYATAIELYRSALASDPQQSHAWVNLGATLEALGRGQEAVAAYRSAVQANPGDALAHFNLGNLYLGVLNFREAIDEYRLAVFYDPTLASAHFNLAQAYILVNVPDSALIAVRNALEFDPANPSAQRMLEDLLDPLP